jgi:hypothetical protein
MIQVSPTKEVRKEVRKEGNGSPRKRKEAKGREGSQL